MEKAIISTLDDAGTTRITIDNSKDAKDFGWSRDTVKQDEVRDRGCNARLFQFLTSQCFCLRRSDRCVSGILVRRIPSTAKSAIEEQKGTGSAAIGNGSVNGTATGTGNGIAVVAATRDAGIEADGVRRTGNLDGETGSGDVAVPVYHQVSFFGGLSRNNVVLMKHSFVHIFLQRGSLKRRRMNLPSDCWMIFLGKPNQHLASIGCH